ncbi:nucleotide pyrophosphohydrolase [bacterium]|nr:nucleotide pyrophosphohydrolase [bacterium]
MSSDSIKQLTDEIRAFSDARNWYPKGRVNLKGIAISISLEAAELLEHFQWVNDVEVAARVEEKKGDLSDELADVVIYALQFADRAGIDLGEAVQKKMEKNGKKYPV